MFPTIYPIVDTGVLSQRGIAPQQFAQSLLEGGARLLQFRHKGAFQRTTFAQASQIAEACRQSGAQLVIDDRTDIAMLLDAGVHVGQDDLPPEAVRRLTSQMLGFSTHNEQQLRSGDREPVDYLAIGPIFRTASKENPDPVVGLDRLAALRALTRKPLVAIGGISLETAPQVLAAGADSVAIIGGLLPDPVTPQTVRQRMEEWLKATSKK